MATFIGLNESRVMAPPIVDDIKKVVLDDDDFAEITVNDNGMIRECNKAVESLFGYAPGKLLWQHISVVLPQLADMPLMHHGEINPRLHFLAHIGRRFEAICVGGMHRAVRICLNDGETMGRHFVRLTLCPAAEECPQ